MTLLAAALALPLAAFAQGPGAGPGQGGKGGPPDPAKVERVEKRTRLARTLGLAEALDLDAQQALKLGDALSRFDDRRLAAHRQMFDAHQVLRRAAQGEKVAQADVDQAIQKAFDARAQMQAIDKEAFAAISKDLSPEKRARALLFLARFQNRFGPRHGGPGGGPGMGPGMGGPGMGRGMHGGRGPGMGPGWGGGPGAGMGMGPGAPGAGPALGMAEPDDFGPPEDGPWASDD